MTCKTILGICRQCYGVDLTTNNLIEIGEAVGTIAAQAIGEPGTQLTMRTFHSGGTATVGGDITHGLPRVEEVFEKRTPKSPAAIARVSGTIGDIRDFEGEKIIEIIPDEKEHSTKKTGGTRGVSKKKLTEYPVQFRRMIMVKVGDHVLKGDFLTDGSANITDLYKYSGKERAQEYIISEISGVYELQGASISRKHIEVIIKQMFSRARVKDAGDTEFTTGDIVEYSELNHEQSIVKENGGTMATIEPLLLGITEISLTRKSFLSAASFQNTTKILIKSAVQGAVDTLRGLKENVIIGRLIPAGTGFKGSPKHQLIQRIQQKQENESYAPVTEKVTT